MLRLGQSLVRLACFGATSCSFLLVDSSGSCAAGGGTADLTHKKLGPQITKAGRFDLSSAQEVRSSGVLSQIARSRSAAAGRRASLCWRCLRNNWAWNSKLPDPDRTGAAITSAVVLRHRSLSEFLRLQENRKQCVRLV